MSTEGLLNHDKTNNNKLGNYLQTGLSGTGKGGIEKM